YKPARFGFAADLDYGILDYEDNTNVYGGEVINSDRDRGTTSAKVRLSYEVMPQRSVYVQGAVNSVEYDEPLDQNGIERSSTGYDVTAGVNFDLSNLLLGDVYVGYLEQNYDSETQEDISSNKYGAGLQWFPSRLTSVNLNVNRTVEESTEETVSGYLSTRARVGVKHQLKRHISLSAGADHTKNDFQQNVEGQKEQESITGFDLEGTLSISRLLYTSLMYRHEYRES
ncbi:MAG: outer membrane beta-barrel protein, partial [Proteobacteria bacterium]|nr:outer membrane beta-barrel protein [Pseudomonadota bacterium]